MSQTITKLFDDQWPAKVAVMIEKLITFAAGAAMLLTPLQATSLTIPESAQNSAGQEIEVKVTIHAKEDVAPATRANLATAGAQEITAMITGYNTVPEQTDSTPCIAAAGDICGRTDVVACPSWIPLHTWVEIEGKQYECMDRTAPKHDGRFDISCDKDMACPYSVHRDSATVRILWE